MNAVKSPKPSPHTSPYMCIRCDGNYFSTLQELCIHVSRDHPNSALVQSIAAEAESPLNRYFGGVDIMFGKYSTKVEEIMKRYDRQAIEIEESAKLKQQLKVIRNQRKRLQQVSAKWEIAHTINNLMQTVDKNIKDRLEIKLKPEPETICKEAVDENKKEENFTKETNNDETLKKQLDAGVQLAAKYKSMAIDLEKRLDETQRSEMQLQQFIHETQQKETKAKRELRELMANLITRAETAEEKLELFEGQWSHNSTLRSMYDSGFPTSYSSTYKSRDNKQSLKQQSSSVPTSPTPDKMKKHNQRHTRRKTTDGFPNYFDESNEEDRNKCYVNSLLEPPSSQELHRKFKPGKQLENIDLANLVNVATMWPFSNKYNDQVSGTKIPNQPQPNDSKNCVVRRRVAVFCVFMHLDIKNLLVCASVCKEWKDVSRHPLLWKHISIVSMQITSKVDLYDLAC